MTAATVWITGLPSSGKSTIAALVAEALRTRGVTVEVLDGEQARRTLSPELGWGRADRLLHARRLAEVAARLNARGATVVVAAVSPYREARAAARALVGPGFVEVHAACDVATCRARDLKGLYARAAAGALSGLTGVDAPYEAPLAPELVLDTQQGSPGAQADRVLRLLAERGLAPPPGPQRAISQT